MSMLLGGGSLPLQGGGGRGRGEGEGFHTVAYIALRALLDDMCL